MFMKEKAVRTVQSSFDGVNTRWWWTMAAPTIGFDGAAIVREGYQATGPSTSVKVPVVGPSAGIVAIVTADRAPSAGVRMPWWLLRSVATNPGHTALTRMCSEARSRAYIIVTAVRAVLD